MRPALSLALFALTTACTESAVELAPAPDLDVPRPTAGPDPDPAPSDWVLAARRSRRPGGDLFTGASLAASGSAMPADPGEYGLQGELHISPIDPPMVGPLWWEVSDGRRAVLFEGRSGEGKVALRTRPLPGPDRTFGPSGDWEAWWSDAALHVQRFDEATPRRFALDGALVGRGPLDLGPGDSLLMVVPERGGRVVWQVRAQGAPRRLGRVAALTESAFAFRRVVIVYGVRREDTRVWRVAEGGLERVAAQPGNWFPGAWSSRSVLWAEQAGGLAWLDLETGRWVPLPELALLQEAWRPVDAVVLRHETQDTLRTLDMHTGEIRPLAGTAEFADYVRGWLGPRAARVYIDWGGQLGAYDAASGAQLARRTGVGYIPDLLFQPDGEIWALSLGDWVDDPGLLRLSPDLEDVAPVVPGTAFHVSSDGAVRLALPEPRARFVTAFGREPRRLFTAPEGDSVQPARGASLRFWQWHEGVLSLHDVEASPSRLLEVRDFDGRPRFLGSYAMTTRQINDQDREITWVDGGAERPADETVVGYSLAAPVVWPAGGGALCASHLGRELYAVRPGEAERELGLADPISGYGTEQGWARGADGTIYFVEPDGTLRDRGQLDRDLYGRVYDAGEAGGLLLRDRQGETRLWWVSREGPARIVELSARAASALAANQGYDPPIIDQEGRVLYFDGPRLRAEGPDGVETVFEDEGLQHSLNVRAGRWVVTVADETGTYVAWDTDEGPRRVRVSEIGQAAGAGWLDDDALRVYGIGRWVVELRTGDVHRLPPDVALSDRLDDRRWVGRDISAGDLRVYDLDGNTWTPLPDGQESSFEAVLR